MLAKLATRLPEGEGWVYEPKWDGFRCIVFRGDGVADPVLELASRHERSLTRYFPELVGPLTGALPEGSVVDGEIVVPAPAGGLDFDALLQRIHPADSRVQRLSEQTPAAFVAFDLLALAGRSLLDTPLVERSALLDSVIATARPPVHRTPATTDPRVAREWFERFEGAGLDGIVAKRLDAPYTPDRRTMVKVKHQRTAECVVAGYRLHRDGHGVGSLLLGLYDDHGTLHHVGVAASFTAAARARLLAELAPLTVDAVEDHPWRDWAEASAHASARLPGARSRWNAGKDLDWVPVRAERVVEVTFGQLQQGRFRHGVRFERWRPDREPRSCTYAQLEVAAPVPFHELV
jgi:ATP-dependent DNA ligase